MTHNADAVCAQQIDQHITAVQPVGDLIQRAGAGKDYVRHAAEPGQQEILGEVLQLPVKYRLPVYLYYSEGYSVRDIGELLSRRESTVQTQLARGREKLKEVLREEL